MALPIVIAPGSSGHIGDHEEIHDILSDVELADLWVVTRFLLDTLANRGAAGRVGSLFLASDVGNDGSLAVDSGSGWLDLYRLMPNATWNLLSGSGADNIAGIRIPAARIGKVAAQSIPDDSAFHTLLWDDESGTNHFNNEGTSLHSITSNTGRLIATREGAWACGAYVAWDANATGRRVLRIQKNNGAVLSRDSRGALGSNEDHHMVHGLVEMEVGDYLQIEVKQNSGGGLNALQESVCWFHHVTDVG